MYQAQGLNRLQGRLFEDGGNLCLVVEADDSTGFGRVSFQSDGVRHLVEMPLMEISRLVAHGNVQIADETSSLKNRVQEEDDGFYAMAREGAIGPFPTFNQAEAAMRAHIEAAMLTNSPAR